MLNDDAMPAAVGELSARERIRWLLGGWTTEGEKRPIMTHEHPHPVSFRQTMSPWRPAAR
jgi:hypothetical protein